ncbi:hypothetical protein WR25_11553 [Diploscapter pachys]|uniref:Uncharacterized protein n=1 Tax=Diploscapter pachys TaxID=2018661 RepID=A0A2A2JQ21_9BILA|nr:hypothetical protein WR25_11553 [Diploscapter pachys]
MNSTEPECVCLSRYLDLRPMINDDSKLEELGLKNNYCMKIRDIDECALGINDCHVCVDLPFENPPEFVQPPEDVHPPESANPPPES